MTHRNLNDVKYKCSYSLWLHGTNMMVQAPIPVTREYQKLDVLKSEAFALSVSTALEEVVK